MQTQQWNFRKAFLGWACEALQAGRSHPPGWAARGPGPGNQEHPASHAPPQQHLGDFLSSGTSDKSNLELITLTCTCVAATLFWLLLTLFIRKLKRVRLNLVKRFVSFYRIFRIYQLVFRASSRNLFCLLLFLCLPDPENMENKIKTPLMTSEVCKRDTGTMNR